ncbi:MAG: DUF1569 domain-containing protein [Planctomycetota bacterium]
MSEVNTGKVANRRKLRWERLDETVADAAALAEAAAENRLTQLGNWTLGQACAHVAYWAERPFEGYPDSVNPPWFMKLFMRLGKPLLFAKGMPTGMRLPGVPGGTLGQDNMPPGEAVERLRAAFAKIDADCPPDPNPLFGPMSHDQWRKLNLRHAELHLSFFRFE